MCGLCGKELEINGFNSSFSYVHRRIYEHIFLWSEILLYRVYGGKTAELE